MVTDENVTNRVKRNKQELTEYSIMHKIFNTVINIYQIIY